jgi:hypothetical protein
LNLVVPRVINNGDLKRERSPLHQPHAQFSLPKTLHLYYLRVVTVAYLEKVHHRLPQALERVRSQSTAKPLTDSKQLLVRCPLTLLLGTTRLKAVGARRVSVHRLLKLQRDSLSGSHRPNSSREDVEQEIQPNRRRLGAGRKHTELNSLLFYHHLSCSLH